MSARRDVQRNGATAASRPQLRIIVLIPRRNELEVSKCVCRFFLGKFLPVAFATQRRTAILSDYPVLDLCGKWFYRWLRQGSAILFVYCFSYGIAWAADDGRLPVFDLVSRLMILASLVGAFIVEISLLIEINRFLSEQKKRKDCNGDR